MDGPLIDVAPCPFDAVQALERELQITGVLAQVLVRRGLTEPERAAAFLAADERHDPLAIPGMPDAVEAVRRHVAAGSPITVHGDYDCDGVCATAIAVRALRALGADPHWFLPGREEDGYGLSTATVERLAARGTRLLITVDCGITAVEEVARARELGIEVIVTDHHRPRGDGVLPDAVIVHPALGDYGCPELCAAGVAHKLAEALVGPSAAADADLAALATVADLVPLQGENRRIVREGLRALATTGKPGLRALMAVAGCDPGRLDARTLGFALAPRINAAGRMARADAALELLLCEDPGRAEQIARELQGLNLDRRDAETRVRFEAEAQIVERGPAAAHVVAGEGWPAGVVGIVAGRLAERHRAPVVAIALDGETGTGSARSIPGYDLLAGLESAAPALERFGGHRAAAGLTVRRDRIDELRAALTAHAAAAISEEDRVPRHRADAVVTPGEMTLALAEELARLEPCGHGNPSPALLVRGAAIENAAGMGEGRHARFLVVAGDVRASAVAFGTPPSQLPCRDGSPADVLVALERNDFNGTVSPRLRLLAGRPAAPAAIARPGRAGTWLERALRELDAPLSAEAPSGTSAGALLLGPERGGATVHDRRGRPPGGLLAALTAGGEPVLAVCADADLRAEVLAARFGGFALVDWHELAQVPELVGAARHVVVLDPATSARDEALVAATTSGQHTHLAWGEPELRFSEQIHERDHDLRVALAALYRALRERGGAAEGELEEVLRTDAGRTRPPRLAGRLLRVLAELSLVSLDRDRHAVTLLPAERTELERSAAFRHYEQRRADGIRFLSRPTAQQAA